MATQPNRAPREVVDFPANVPVTVALKYSQGKTISNQYGERIMFSLADGRVMFLDPEVAGRIEPLGINVREDFTITRKWDGKQGSPVSWEVARISAGKSNGVSPGHSVSPKPPASAPLPFPGASRHPAGSLVEESKNLIDAFAAVWEYARETYRGQIKTGEVRAFVTTAYIQRGRSAAA